LSKNIRRQATHAAEFYQCFTHGNLSSLLRLRKNTVTTYPCQKVFLRMKAIDTCLNHF
jgi:hypothetical protein